MQQIARKHSNKLNSRISVIKNIVPTRIKSSVSPGDAILTFGRHTLRRRTSVKMAHFDPPAIQENDNGWGPSAVPEKFKDMPYQPFAKGDRLGKVRLQNIPPLEPYGYGLSIWLERKVISFVFCLIIVQTNWGYDLDRSGMYVY